MEADIFNSVPRNVLIRKLNEAHIFEVLELKVGSYGRL